MKNFDFLKEAYKYKEEAIDFTIELMKYKTVLDTYDESSTTPFGEANKDCLHAFLAKGESDGFISKNVNNYAGHIEFGNEDKLVGILGHLDVVPALEDTWNTDPFTPTIIDNKIYGRGALDDKGPTVSAYYAIKLLKDLNIVPSKKVRLIVGCDEESGSRCLNEYFKHEQMPQEGFSPDAEFPLIYGEKAFQNFDLKIDLTNTSITNFESGSRTNIVPDIAFLTLSVDLEKEYNAFLKEFNYSGEFKDNRYYAYGKSCHAMQPDHGLNANFILLHFLSIYLKNDITTFLYENIAFDYDGTKLGINTTDVHMGNLSINAGLFKVENNILTISFDCRIPKDNYKEQMVIALDNKIGDICGITYVFKRETPLHFVNPDDNLVKTLVNAYREITNDYETSPMTIGGGTYAKFIKNCVAFGPLLPGKPDVIHQANEYIEIDELVQNIAIYAKSIYELIK